MIKLDANVRGRIRLTCTDCDWTHIWTPSSKLGASADVHEVARIGAVHDLHEHGVFWEVMMR